MNIDNKISYMATEEFLMNIVICDDEKSICAELENIIKSYASERKVKIQTDVFFGWGYTDQISMQRRRSRYYFFRYRNTRL